MSLVTALTAADDEDEAGVDVVKTTLHYISSSDAVCIFNVFQVSTTVSDRRSAVGNTRFLISAADLGWCQVQVRRVLHLLLGVR